MGELSAGAWDSADCRAAGESGGTSEEAGARDRYFGYSGVDGRAVEAGGAGRNVSAGEAGGESAAGCRCDRVAEEGWRGVSDAGEPVVAGADAGGFGGAVEEVRAGREYPLIAWGK